jgi:hypothetical protein
VHTSTLGFWVPWAVVLVIGVALVLGVSLVRERRAATSRS